MMKAHRSRPLLASLGFPFLLTSIFLAVLLLAGGASRADALGQAVVRAAAASVIILAVVLRWRIHAARDRFVLIMLAATTLLLLAQLVPLPPVIWKALPARTLTAAIAPLLGEPQPFRPLSLSPDRTLNALLSLIVPIAMAIAVACVPAADRQRLIGVSLLGVAFTAFVGVIQFSGMVMANPLINETAGASSGIFANRNHQALLLAIGIPLAACWSCAVPPSGRRRTPIWRLASAGGLIAWFLLMILATGSRAGLLLGAAALCTAAGIVVPELRRMITALPRWTMPVTMIAVLACVVGVVGLSLVSNRAVSLDRLAAMDIDGDMRTRGTPVVLSMIRDFFPTGAGAGTFDPVFRIYEPFSLLKHTYFNHAHNDYLEILLDDGIAGGILVLAALAWWGWRSVAAWRGNVDSDKLVARLGSSVILLTFLASAIDYPARTPLIMGMLVIACAWLGSAASSPRPLRASNHSL